MQPGFEPYITPDDDGAVDRAKAFCKSRGLTPDVVKISRKDGMVRIVVKKECKIAV